MSTYTATVSEKLNDLLEKTYDAEKGYKKACDNTDNPYLKSFFEKKSEDRQRFGLQLKSEISSLGQEWEKDGSLEAAAHRTWMDFKAFFSADDDEAMLEEAIRGEKASVEEYREVLSDTSLPPSTTTLLTQQMNQIEADLNQVKRLEDLS